MSSTSAAGVSIITLQFALGLTLDVAEQEVQAAINAGGSLPAGRPAGAAGVRQGQPGRRAGADAGDHLRHAAADRGAEPGQHAARAEDQPGHAASAWSRSRAASGRRCGSRPTPQALASYGIGLDTLRTAIAAANANSAKGSFDGPTRSLHDQRQRPADHRRRLQEPDRRLQERRAGAPAPTSRRSSTSAENTQLGAWAGKRRAAPAIILNVQRQPGANVIATVDAIKAQLPELQAALPAALRGATCSPTAPPASAPRCAHVEIELRAGGRDGRAGDLRLPAQPARDGDRQPRGADLADRQLAARCTCSATA